MKTVPEKTALLVIDVQESFRHRPYWQAGEADSFLANTQALIDRARESGIAVLQVFHQEFDGGTENPFHPGTGFVRAMPELKITPAAVFHKEVHSALYGRTTDADGTEITLEKWLRGRGIDNLVVTGIRTEQCCETTTRHACDAGFKVWYVIDATLTFPMQSRSGRRFSPAEIRERTELVLHERFAQVVTVNEALL